MDFLFISTVLLPGAVAVIMFGLGLELTVDDFRRVARRPRAVVTGLAVQTVVLVGLAYLITQLFGLPPELAVGLMLLASAPGGALANVFSHFARGDVALNITLTAVNSLLALVWLPLVLEWSLAHFLGAGQYVPPPVRKLLEMATIVMVPVLAGMVVRRQAPGFTDRAAPYVRRLVVALVLVVLAVSIHAAHEELLAHLATVGLACLTFNLVSMAIGYGVPRLVGLGPRESVSISFEIGVHNAAIAIYVAFAVLQNPVIGMPASVYGLIQILTASLAVLWLRRRSARGDSP
jgi:BASS family bile acid:Na+ symporter